MWQFILTLLMNNCPPFIITYHYKECYEKVSLHTCLYTLIREVKLLGWWPGTFIFCCQVTLQKGCDHPPPAPPGCVGEVQASAWSSSLSPQPSGCPLLDLTKPHPLSGIRMTKLTSKVAMSAMPENPSPSHYHSGWDVISTPTKSAAIIIFQILANLIGKKLSF